MDQNVFSREFNLEADAQLYLRERHHFTSKTGLYISHALGGCGLLVETLSTDVNQLRRKSSGSCSNGTFRFIAGLKKSLMEIPLTQRGEMVN